MDVSKISYDALKILCNRNPTLISHLKTHLVKRLVEDECNKYESTLETVDEKLLYGFIKYCFYRNENKKSLETSKNIKKLLLAKNMWTETIDSVSIYDEYAKLDSINSNLYTCLLYLTDSNFTLENIHKMLGQNQKAFDVLVGYALYLDDIEILQKLITKDDLYVKLKYYYKIECLECSNIINFFKKIEHDRQSEKVRSNILLKNTDEHSSAINEGELLENYNRYENVFGMTPDDNIIAKLLLMYNKIFNKKEAMNDKDLATLKNMRKSLNNIKRNSECNFVDSEYFYSLDLHNLFFVKSSSAEVAEKIMQSNKTKISTDKSEPNMPALEIDADMPALEIDADMPALEIDTSSDYTTASCESESEVSTLLKVNTENYKSESESDESCFLLFFLFFLPPACLALNWFNLFSNLLIDSDSLVSWKGVTLKLTALLFICSFTLKW